MAELFGFASTLNGEVFKDSLSVIHVEVLEKTVLLANKRKAKNVVVTAAEFILSVLTIWQTLNHEVDRTLLPRTKFLLLTALIYSFMAGVAIMWHAQYRLGENINAASPCSSDASVHGCHVDANDGDDDKKDDCESQLPLRNHIDENEPVGPGDSGNDSPRVRTTTARAAEALEKAYRKTNNYPLVDGFLEIPLSFRFLSWRDWWVPVIAWTFFCGLLANLIVNLITLHQPTGVLTSCILATIQGYRFTSDVCEYWVYTHHECIMGTSRPNNTRGLSGGDLTGNADDSDISLSEAHLDCNESWESDGHGFQRDRSTTTSVDQNMPIRDCDSTEGQSKVSSKYRSDDETMALGQDDKQLRRHDACNVLHERPGLPMITTDRSVQDKRMDDGVDAQLTIKAEMACDEDSEMGDRSCDRDIECQPSSNIPSHPKLIMSETDRSGR